MTFASIRRAWSLLNPADVRGEPIAYQPPCNHSTTASRLARCSIGSPPMSSGALRIIPLSASFCC
jgi:hypothetical protein